MVFYPRFERFQLDYRNDFVLVWHEPRQRVCAYLGAWNLGQYVFFNHRIAVLFAVASARARKPPHPISFRIRRIKIERPCCSRGVFDCFLWDQLGIDTHERVSFFPDFIKKLYDIRRHGHRTHHCYLCVPVTFLTREIVKFKAFWCVCAKCICH